MECIKSKHYQSLTIVFIIAPQSTEVVMILYVIGFVLVALGAIAKQDL